MEEKTVKQLFDKVANCIEILDQLTKQLEERCKILEQKIKDLEKTLDDRRQADDIGRRYGAEN